MRLGSPKAVTERAIGVGAIVLAVLAPFLFSDFYVNSILTQALILGIGAASLIFLSAYGGMISLAQAGLMGIAGYALANMEQGAAASARTPPRVTAPNITMWPGCDRCRRRT